MSTNKKNIEANYNIMDFTLSSIDMARIDTLNKNGFRVVTKDKAPGHQIGINNFLALNQPLSLRSLLLARSYLNPRD